MSPQKTLIDVFDDRISSEGFPVEFAGDRQPNLGEDGSRGRHASGAIEAVAHRFPAAGRIGDAAMEVDRPGAVKRLGSFEMVEIDLERFGDGPAGVGEGAVSLVANADALKRLVAELDRSFDPGKVGSELVAMHLTHRFVRFRRLRLAREPIEEPAARGGQTGVFRGCKREMDVPEFAGTENVVR